MSKDLRIRGFQTKCWARPNFLLPFVVLSVAVLVSSDVLFLVFFPSSFQFSLCLLSLYSSFVGCVRCLTVVLLSLVFFSRFISPRFVRTRLIRNQFCLLPPDAILSLIFCPSSFQSLLFCPHSFCLFRSFSDLISQFYFRRYFIRNCFVRRQSVCLLLLSGPVSFYPWSFARFLFIRFFYLHCSGRLRFFTWCRFIRISFGSPHLVVLSLFTS